MKEYYELWLVDYGEKGLRKKTISRYKTLWPRIYECLGHFEIQKIKPTHLIQFYNMLTEDGVRLDGKPGGLSPTTIRHHHTFLSSMLETAVTLELINSNPCSKVKLSKIGLSSKDIRIRTDEMIYSFEEVKNLLRKIDDAQLKYKVIVYLAIFTGCRREEILGLEWNDINFDTGEIRIERAIQYNVHDGTYEDDLKTSKSRRSCFVPQKILDILNKYRLFWEYQKNNAISKNICVETDKLFIQKNFSPMHPDSVTSWFSKFLKKVGLPHTRFHNLRHIHVSILIKMGMDLSSIADQAGHSDLQMITRVYPHNLNKKNYETAEYLKKALLDEE